VEGLPATDDEQAASSSALDSAGGETESAGEEIARCTSSRRAEGQKAMSIEHRGARSHLMELSARGQSHAVSDPGREQCICRRSPYAYAYAHTHAHVHAHVYAYMYAYGTPAVYQSSTPPCTTTERQVNCTSLRTELPTPFPFASSASLPARCPISIDGGAGLAARKCAVCNV
jgi:hypothetical protein